MQTKKFPDFRDIWEFIELPKNREKMKNATSKGHPAVEPLGPELEREFDLNLLEPKRLNLLKLLIGNRVLKIMKKMGYKKAKVPDPKDPNRLIDRKGTITGNLFESGQIYCKRGN